MIAKSGETGLKPPTHPQSLQKSFLFLCSSPSHKINFTLKIASSLRDIIITVTMI